MSYEDCSDMSVTTNEKKRLFADRTMVSLGTQSCNHSTVAYTFGSPYVVRRRPTIVQSNCSTIYSANVDLSGLRMDFREFKERSCEVLQKGLSRTDNIAGRARSALRKMNQSIDYYAPRPHIFSQISINHQVRSTPMQFSGIPVHLGRRMI